MCYRYFLPLLLVSCTNAVPKYSASGQSSVLAISSDSRTPDSIFVGNHETTIINGTCERDDLPINLWIDGSKIEGAQALCANGQFHFTYSSLTLSEGTHSVHISVNPTIDSVSATADLKFIKDLTVPVVTTPNLNELASDGVTINGNVFTAAWLGADGTGSPIDYYNLEQFAGAGCLGSSEQYSKIVGLSNIVEITSTHSFKLHAFDMAGNEGISTCSKSIKYNLPPIAQVDHIYAFKDDLTPFVFDIIANDSDPEGLPLQLDSVANTGPDDFINSIQVNPVGKNNFIQITIKPNVRGTDTINYSFHDSLGQAATGTFKIHIVTRNTWIGHNSAAWNLGSNWCGSVNDGHTGCNGLAASQGLPSLADNDTVVFDELSSDCNINLATVSIYGMLLDKGFTGNVTHQNGSTIIFGTSGGYVQRSGNFIGSLGNSVTDYLDLDGPMEIEGGNFRSTRGRLKIEKSLVIKNLESVVNFDANEGTLEILCKRGNLTSSQTSNCEIDVPAATKFHKVILKPGSYSSIYGSITITNGIDVYSDLTLDNPDGTAVYVNGGAINAYGNVTVGSYGIKGTSVLNITGGSGVNQILSAPTIGATFPNTVIDSSGTVTLTGNHYFTFLHNLGSPAPFFTYKKGTIVATGSNVFFACVKDLQCKISLEGNLFLYSLNLIGEMGNVNGAVTIENNGNRIIVDNGVAYQMQARFPFFGGIIEAHSGVLNRSCGYDVVGTTKLLVKGNSPQISSDCVDSSFPPTVITSTGTVYINSEITFGASYLGSPSSSIQIFKVEGGSVFSPIGSKINFVCKNGITCSIDTGSSPLAYNGLITLDASSAEGLSSAFNLTKFQIDANFQIMADTNVISSDIIYGDIYSFRDVTIANNLASNIYFKNPLNMYFSGTLPRSLDVFNYNSLPDSSVLDFGTLNSSDVNIINTTGTFGPGVVTRDTNPGFNLGVSY